MGFIESFFPLLILAAIIFAAYSFITRRRGASGAPAIEARHVFFYLFSFAALMVFASGASVLIDYIVDSLRGGLFVEPGENQLALGLALSIVGAPAWLFTWRRILRTTAARPAERRSVVRGLYMFLVQAVSVSFAAAGLVGLVTVLLRGDNLEGTHVAWPVAWGAIWAYHWWIESTVPVPDREANSFRSIYVHIVSLAAVVIFLVGVGIIMHRLIDRAYAELFIDGRFVAPALWGQPVKTSIALAVVGGAGWWWHWLRAAQAEPPTVSRQVYLYIFGVLGGVVTFVVSVSLVLVALLQWLLATPTISPADEHFRILTGLLPAMLAGVLMWRYHAAIIKQEASAGVAADSARRAYDYLLASLSLATLGAGLVFLVALFISASVSEARDYLVDRTGWQGQLSIVLTLIGVGGSIWGYYWYAIQRKAAADPEELETTSRRVHIYSVFGVSALAALGSLSATLYILLEDLFDQTLNAATLQDAQWAIAVLVATGAISGYFWFVIREDRKVLAQREPARPRARKRVTVLLPEVALSAVDELESRLGYEVSVWIEENRAMAALPSGEQIDAAVAAIEQAPSERVLVVSSEAGLEVRPHRIGQGAGR